MKRKIILNLIVLFAILYFIWLFIVALVETMNSTIILIELKIWALIGVIIYIFFLMLELALYFTSPIKEEKEYKLISDTITRVMCSNCKTTFTISDNGIRPMAYICPNCNREGALKGNTTEGFQIVITCSRCETDFEIFDTGDRPLSYECPSCHFEGVVESC